ncbi:peptidoglycan-binding domain-containing protein [Cryptosporangium minutisporangium]|uniref:Peptidoglycan binding-like domain-containing protein n=1 Tax=Cryptosporangium minutisporangium TaxID=113569 RepID=A0ABP6T0S3_9ACTN
MTMRKRVAVAAAVLALGGGLAVLPSSPAAAAYTCRYSERGIYAYAGYYSGNTVQPSSTGVSNAGIEAQCLLKAYGYSPGTIDGIFGTNSRAKAKAFQRHMNLAFDAGLVEDGKVGPATWPWLREMVAITTSP